MINFDRSTVALGYSHIDTDINTSKWLKFWHIKM